MPRPQRDFTTDNRFHIINHSVDGQDLFSIDDDWTLFESLIGRVCEEYGFRLNAYALMSNHYHMLADVSDCEDRSQVSAAIGIAQSTYANYFNERTSRRGPLFQPRFLSFGVTGDDAIHRTIRYIHRNPISICGPRALGNYRWSSLPVVVGRRAAPTWLNCTMFTPNNPIEHLAALADCRPEDLWPLGSLAPQRVTTVDEIERAVGFLPMSVPPKVRRCLEVMLALDLRAIDVVDLGERYDRAPSSLRQAAARARIRRGDDAEFRRLVERVEEALVQRLS